MPPPHLLALIYEWQNLTRGQLRWVAADHMIPALKSQARNVDRALPHLNQKKKKPLMPHFITDTLPVSPPPQSLIYGAMPSRRGTMLQ